MIVAAVIDRSSKLATARGLRAETAASSLGAVLGLEACDQDELYEAMDCCCPGSRRSRTPSRPGIWPAGRWCCMTCPRPRSRAGPARWGRSGMPRGGVQGRLQIVYGVLTSAAGIPVAVQVFKGATGDPATLAGQVTKLKGRFGLSHVALVGDRGMLTKARIRDDVKPARAGLDHRAARPGAQGPHGQGRHPALPVRRDRHGRDHPPGLPRRAADRLPQPLPGSRARPQARRAARCHRSRAGKDRRGDPAGPPTAARQGHHRPGRRQGDQQAEGRQALHHRHHRRRPVLAGSRRSQARPPWTGST